MQKIEYIKIDLIKNHPSNPRLIKDEAFKKLCESISANKDYFETRPILCNTDMVVFAGNMRLRAAKEIGMLEVPCAIMDIPEERQKEIMIRDNRSNGEWDYQMLSSIFDNKELLNLGFSEFELGLDIYDGDEKEGDQDEDIEPFTLQSEEYILGTHRLICGSKTSESDRIIRNWERSTGKRAIKAS